jgi:hypothetical protein
MRKSIGDTKNANLIRCQRLVCRLESAFAGLASLTYCEAGTAGTALRAPWIRRVREARFKLNADGKTPDGGVHSIFTITGLKDAEG